MVPELQRRFDVIEDQRRSLQNEALGLSEAQLLWAPPAAWSIGQVIEHLVLSDETIGQAQNPGALGSEGLIFRLVPPSWRFALVVRALKRNTALPLPSPEIEPSGQVSLSHLLERWDSSRAQMQQALATLQDHEKRYFHPVLGPLTAAQMLELGETHTAYHRRQIAAIRHDNAFPAK